MKHKSKDLKLRAILYYYKSKNQTQTSKIHRLVLDFLVHSLEAYYGNVWSCLDIKNINGSIL